MSAFGLLFTSYRATASAYALLLDCNDIKMQNENVAVTATTTTTNSTESTTSLPGPPAARNQLRPVIYADSFACTYAVSVVAACIAELATYPLDLTKTRLQIQGEATNASGKVSKVNRIMSDCKDKTKPYTINNTSNFKRHVYTQALSAK